MAKTLRVHILARELNVSSKAIIDKCQAEGIELKNHMAAISAGLAESIREWFITGVDVTSVELAEAVDLTRAHKIRRRKAAELALDGATAVAVGEFPDVETDLAPREPATASSIALIPVEPPEVGQKVAIVPAPTVEPLPTLAPAVLQPAALVEPGKTEPAEQGPMELAAVAPLVAEPLEAMPSPPSEPAKSVEPSVVILPPTPREPIKPAGPQLVPRPAELKGPRVVRIEAPDRVPTRRPRPAPIMPDVTVPRPGVETGGGDHARGVRRKEDTAQGTRAGRPRSPRRHDSGADAIARVKEWRDQDLLERRERLASATGQGLRERRAAERRRRASTPGAPAQSVRKTSIEIKVPVVLKDFCAAVGMPFTWVLGKLIEHSGAPRTINQTIDAALVELLALELGITVDIVQAKTAYEKLQEEFAAHERNRLLHRPPVVAMLGHVDHGKTSLLDAIRKTRVTAQEAGGITQHIGAYRVKHDEWDVTFLDTPGHEAFTAMRARGANLTDVVVLVVAADDGVMPQTVEAINHARAADVPIVVALNKIDLLNIDLNKVYGQLAEHGLAPSEWGGETDVIKTSATTGQGIDDLLAHLSTLSELLDLKADAQVPAQGVVIEAQMREGEGVVAQVLVREGTLRTGQAIICGPGAGRVRALRDHTGKRVGQATPGTPVEVSGLDELPEAGDRLYQLDDLSRTKEIASEIRARRREQSLQTTARPRTLEELLAGGEGSEVPELRVILRADVQGSVDALRSKLGEFPAEKARLSVLHAGVGTITEADVRLAQASEAIIIGFHIVPEERARQLAEQIGVEIRLYRIIYEILEDMHKALEGLLEPEEHEEQRGMAEVRQIFNVTRFGTVAGCLVADGVVARAHKVRLIRDGRVMLEGANIASLRRFKDDAREVRAGLECGIKIDGYDDVKPGDVIQAYEIVEVAQAL